MSFPQASKFGFVTETFQKMSRVCGSDMIPWEPVVVAKTAAPKFAVFFSTTVVGVSSNSLKVRLDESRVCISHVAS